MKKQVQVHLEQVKKHEHSLEQQKMMLADVQLRLVLCGLWLRKRRSQRGPLFNPRCLLLGNPSDNGEQIVPSLDLEMEATPLDSDDDEMEERDAGSWQTVASTRKKRNKAPVVMKLKGTPASIRKGSLRQNFVDKTCTFENDMSGVEVAKALLRLSPDGINGMISTLPPGVVDRFMIFQPKFKTIHEIATSSSSSSSGEGSGLVEFFG